MISLSHETLARYAQPLFTTDSPTGYTADAIQLIASWLREMGYEPILHNKGTLEVVVAGRDPSKTVATSAHVDTLGLMVRSIKGSGTLALTKVGGPLTPTLDGEYCQVVTREGKRYSGTILSTSPAVHVYPDAASASRDIDHLEVRLDEEVASADDVRKLGIENGDFILIDPKYTLTESGFLKSRFIDDKASVVVLLALLEHLKNSGETLRHPTHFYFVVYEEVGHGASAVSHDIDEFVTCDMGCVGMDLAGNEYAVSICAKDSGGPYSYALVGKLAILKYQESRDAHDAVLLSKLHLLIYIDLADLDVCVLFCDLVNNRREHLAGAAPYCPEIYQNRLVCI
jgi:putative aminopeptidase FrvX